MYDFCISEIKGKFGCSNGTRSIVYNIFPIARSDFGL